MPNTGKSGFKPYNPFLRDPDLKDLPMSTVKKTSMLFSKDGKSLANIEAGEIYLTQHLSYRQLISIYSGLNFFYPIVVVINKAWDKDFLNSLNHFYHQVERSTLRCYSIYYPHAYKKEFIDKKKKKRYKIFNDIQMKFDLYTRLKRSGNKPNPSFFKVVDEERITPNLINQSTMRIKNTEKACLALLKQNQVSLDDIKIFSSCVFRSVYTNLKEILNLIQKVKKEKDLYLDFDLETLVQRQCHMIYSGLRFLLKMKCLQFPKKKKGFKPHPKGQVTKPFKPKKG